MTVRTTKFSFESTAFAILITSVFAVFILFGETTAQSTVRTNGRIAFTSDRDGNREIYIMNSDGTNQKRLTTNLVVDDYPTWSPNGKKIAFVGEKPNGTFAIFQMDADGKNKVEITYINRYFVNSPAWFSDFWSMSWSPDGGRIVFQDHYGTHDIVVVDINGNNRSILTDAAGWDHQPAWSPDGSTILFSSFNRLRAYPTLFTMKSDGTNLQAFPGFDGNWETGSNWSPAGDKVVFIDDRTDNISDSFIRIENADGTNRQVFDEGPGVEYRNRPSWSPDGRKILFGKWIYLTGDMEIYAKNTDGSGFVQLTDTSGWNYHPSWQSIYIRPDHPEVGEPSDD